MRLERLNYLKIILSALHRAWIGGPHPGFGEDSGGRRDLPVSQIFPDPVGQSGVIKAASLATPNGHRVVATFNGRVTPSLQQALTQASFATAQFVHFGANGAQFIHKGAKVIVKVHVATMAAHG